MTSVLAAGVGIATAAFLVSACSILFVLYLQFLSLCYTRNQSFAYKEG